MAFKADKDLWKAKDRCQRLQSSGTIIESQHDLTKHCLLCISTMTSTDFDHFVKKSRSKGGVVNASTLQGVHNSKANGQLRDNPNSDCTIIMAQPYSNINIVFAIPRDG